MTDADLTVALGRAAALGSVGPGSNSSLRVDVREISPIHKAFAPMVRELAYDMSELAIVTALQAVEAQRPIAILPAVVAARHQRGCLVTRADRSVADPTELRGMRIGVRAYTQTTGMWVRRHLAEDYALSASDFTWVTKDAAHVEEYRDPSFVRRELGGSVVDALRAGEVDAAILGNDLPEGEFRRATPEAAERDAQWSVEHGYVPINHVLVASTTAIERRSDDVQKVYHSLREAAERSASADRPAPLFGVPGLTTPLDEIVAACVSQGLLSRPLSSGDVLSAATRLLGEE